MTAEELFWTMRDTDSSWNDVVARRDARVLRVARRLTRRDGATCVAEVSAASKIERNYGYGLYADTKQSLTRLIRQRKVLEVQFANGKYLVAGEITCPTCGAPL